MKTHLIANYLFVLYLIYLMYLSSSYFLEGSIPMCDGRLIDLFVKLYVVADDVSVTVFARRFIPYDTNYVRCLKFVRHAYWGTSRRAFRSEEVFSSFLAKAHLILSRYVKFVLNTAFWNTKVGIIHERTDDWKLHIIWFDRSKDSIHLKYKMYT